ncbi:MAG TPA: hypothetical protein PK650_13065 [Candidatus Sumerlaeota bacterium]|nr:hypothetical protein [Candidatus Sumerlaeota bacterium]HOE64672.1 hypothetical protein [Candidatus Sumerlaeota bacterium]
MTDYHVDMSDLIKGLNKSDARIMEAIEKGLAQAGMQLLNDATLQIPATPLDEGTLRGSGSVFVGNKLVGTSPPINGKGEPNRQHQEPMISMVKTATVGFNTPYAAWLHETPELDFGSTREKRGLPRPTGTGAFYLSKKMATNFRLYMQIVAHSIKRFLGK